MYSLILFDIRSADIMFPLIGVYSCEGLLCSYEEKGWIVAGLENPDNYICFCSLGRIQDNFQVI